MADIRVGGQRFRQVFPTAGLAEKFIEEKRAQKVDVKAGRLVRHASAPDVTYADAIAELREQYRAGIPRPLTTRTLESYESQLDILARHWTGAVGQTSTSDVDAWIGGMRRAKLASSTIRHQCDRLSAVHQLAVRRGWLAALPCEVTRPRLVMASEPDALPEVDYAQVLKSAHGDREATVILLLAGDAGLRLSEIWRLAWRDARFGPGATGSLHVRVENEKRRTKSGKGRNVPMTPRLRAAIWSLKRADGPVIMGAESESAITWRASRAWRPVLGEDATLHRLRHRYGTQLVLSGVPLPIVQKLMGHAKIETTMRYVHVVPEVAAGVLARVGRATGGQRRGPDRASRSEPNARRLRRLGEVPEWLNGTVC
jgi:integrase